MKNLTEPFINIMQPARCRRLKLTIFLFKRDVAKIRIVERSLQHIDSSCYVRNTTGVARISCDRRGARN